LLKFNSQEEAVGVNFCIVRFSDLNGDELAVVAVEECLSNGCRGVCCSGQRQSEEEQAEQAEGCSSELHVESRFREKFRND